MKTLALLSFFWDKAQRPKLMAIFLGITLMGILEMAGIASILPFLMVLSEPQIILTHPILSQIYHDLGFTQIQHFMCSLGALVLAVLVIGNLFASFMSWIMLRLSFRQGEKISQRLFKKYLSQPYPFFLHRHSTHLANNVLSEIDRLAIGIFFSILQTTSKALVIICIVGLLIAMNPFVALISMVVLGGAYLGIYRIMRRKLMLAGQIATQENKKRHQLVQEAFSCIKELKVLNRAFCFVAPFASSSHRYIKAETLSQLLPLTTRYFIEIIAFGGMVMVAMILIVMSDNMTDYIPMLGLYALAGYRLMPAMQYLYANFSNLGYYHAVLETIYQESQLPDNALEVPANQPLSFKNRFVLKDVHYRYPQSPQDALQAVNLIVPQHAMIGLVGASGAGKTTLVDVILGLLHPTQGSIWVDDQKIGPDNVAAWQRNIGYVSQSIVLIDASIAENIALGIRPEDIDYQAVEKAARLAELHGFVTTTLPQGYQTTIGEHGVRLSGGQRQRIGIARALYHDPELLIFDEATSALDQSTEGLILSAIQSLAHRKTIIIIAHRLNTVKDCDIIYELDKGQLAGQGKFDAALLHPV